MGACTEQGLETQKTNPWQLIITRHSALVGFRWQGKRDIQHRSAELYSLNYGLRGEFGKYSMWFGMVRENTSFGGGWIFFFCQTFCPEGFSECDSLLCLQVKKQP